MKTLNAIALSIISLVPGNVYAAAVSGNTNVEPGFTIPSLADVVSFLIKFLFFFAGLAALLYLLLGAMSWVTSSGDKEAVKKAQDKIQAAVVGLVIIVVALVLIATLEQFVLKGSFCTGLTCNLNESIPRLLKP